MASHVRDPSSIRAIGRDFLKNLEIVPCSFYLLNPEGHTDGDTKKFGHTNH